MLNSICFNADNSVIQVMIQTCHTVYEDSIGNKLLSNSTTKMPAMTGSDGNPIVLPSFC